MEPYCPDAVHGPNFLIRALIGNAQNTNDFQDIPLNVCVADAVNAFGMYIKYIVLVDGENVSECMQGVTGEKRDAFEVLMSVCTHD